MYVNEIEETSDEESEKGCQGSEEKREGDEISGEEKEKSLLV